MVVWAWFRVVPAHILYHPIWLLQAVWQSPNCSYCRHWRFWRAVGKTLGVVLLHQCNWRSQWKAEQQKEQEVIWKNETNIQMYPYMPCTLYHSNSSSIMLLIFPFTYNILWQYLTFFWYNIQLIGNLTNECEWHACSEAPAHESISSDRVYPVPAFKCARSWGHTQVFETR